MLIRFFIYSYCNKMVLFGLLQSCGDWAILKVFKIRVFREGRDIGTAKIFLRFDMPRDG